MKGIIILSSICEDEMELFNGSQGGILLLDMWAGLEFIMVLFGIDHVCKVPQNMLMFICKLNLH